MDYNSYFNKINESNLNKKLNLVSSNLTFVKNNDIIIVDTTWIDIFEEAIPYIDHIVRNPRSFIMEEEALVPIEKTKVVSEASIKHLAQNTNLIQEVQKDGTVIPVKLLNIYREDTSDLYENRFIKTLIQRIDDFINDRIEEGFSESVAKVSNNVNYTGLIKTGNEEVNIQVKLNSKLNKKKEIDIDNIKKRIFEMQNIIQEYKESIFVKNLQNSEYVHSPLRRTNVLLKEPNFNKALDLWEYIENNRDRKFKVVDKSVKDVNDESIKRAFDFTFCLENGIINGKDKIEFNERSNDDLTRIINEYVFNNDVTESEFKKMIVKEYNDAKKRKAKKYEFVQESFINIINDFDKKSKKIDAILK